MSVLPRLPILALICAGGAGLLDPVSAARPLSRRELESSARALAGGPVSVRAVSDGSASFGLPGWELVLEDIMEVHPTPAGLLLRRRSPDGRDEFGMVAAKEGFRRLSWARYRELRDRRRGV